MHSRKKTSPNNFLPPLGFHWDLSFAMAVLIETNLGDIVIDLKVRKEGTKGHFFLATSGKQMEKNVKKPSCFEVMGGPSLWLGKRKTRKFGGSGIRVEGKTRCVWVVFA